MDHFIATQTYEDLYYVPPDEWLPVFSMGYDEALASLLWMKALVYYGEEIAHQGAVQHSFRYADAIITLDPKFRAVYRWAALAGLYRPKFVDFEREAKEAIGYLELGVRRFPDDGTMAWDAGASLTYELAPHVEDEGEKAELRRRGLEYMQSAARLGAAPDWLVLSNVASLEKLGETEQAIRHLEEMYTTVSDEEVREEVRLRLVTLRGQSYATALQHVWAEAEARRTDGYDFVPPTFFHIMEPKAPVPLVDLLKAHFDPAFLRELSDQETAPLEPSPEVDPAPLPAPSHTERREDSNEATDIGD